jgi:hypothetical protein
MLGFSVRSRLRRQSLLSSSGQFPADHSPQQYSAACLAVFRTRAYQTLTKEDVRALAEHRPGLSRVFFGALSLHFQPCHRTINTNRSFFNAADHCVGAISAARPAAVRCVPWAHSTHFNIPVYHREEPAKPVPPHPELITMDAVHPGFRVATFNRLSRGRSSKLCP